MLFLDSMIHAYPIDTGCIFGAQSDVCQNTPGLFWIFNIYSLMRWLVLAILSVSDGRKVSNAHLVVMSVSLGIFRRDHEFWNVANAGSKSVLQLAL